MSNTNPQNPRISVGRDVKGNITDGNVYGDVSYSYSENQNQDSAEIAIEIQQLLEQLSKFNPTNTTLEKMAVATETVKHIESDQKLKNRVISALKAGGTQALAQLLNHPAASFVIAGLEDLHKTR